MSQLFPNFVSGRWQAGTGAGTPLFDPVLGHELARVDASGLDLQGAFDFAREQGGAALRALNYRAKELDLRLPLLESLLLSNTEHIERAVEAVLRTGKKKVGVLGLSFKSGTDDLRESPLVHLVKRLIGEGCQIQIWDQNVALGRRIGSNRQFITDFIPHIGSLLSEDARQVIEKAEVVLIGTKALDNQTLFSYLRPDHIVIDLVNLEKRFRYDGRAAYEGICW